MNVETKYIDSFHKKYKIQAESGCWEWTACRLPRGYGYIATPYEGLAHRFSALIHGLDMSKPVVRHLCNNPCCVNPAHLATGTQKENIEDMLRANRQRRGTDKHSNKLSEAEVKAIRQRYKPRVCSYRKLAAEYKVNFTVIRDIVKYRLWRHI